MTDRKEWRAHLGEGRETLRLQAEWKEPWNSSGIRESVHSTRKSWDVSIIIFLSVTFRSLSLTG